MLRIIFFFSFISLTLQLTGTEKDSIQHIDLDEFVVSAFRTPAKNRNVTQQITVINRQTIENANAPTTADLLARTGNVHVQKSQQGGGSPVLRGFEASRILLYIDNVPMNNLIYRSGHLQNMISIDVSSLSRMEVLYGPSSVAYGSDALGGVIHFFTVNPELNSKLKINASTHFASSNNEKNAHISFSSGTDKWGFLTSINGSDFGHLKAGRNRNPFLPENDAYIRLKNYIIRENNKDSVAENKPNFLQYGSAYKQIDLLQKVLFQPTENERHLLNLQYSTTTNIPRYDRLTETKMGIPRYAEWYYGPQERLLASYDYSVNNKFFADKTGLTIAFQNLKESRHNRRTFDAVLDNRTENVQMLTLSSFWTKHTDKIQFTGGLDGSLNFLKSTAFRLNYSTNTKIPLDTRYPDGKNFMHHIDVFSNMLYTANNKLSFTAGARAGFSMLFAEFIDKTFFPFPTNVVTQNNFTWSGAGGVSYTPDNTLKLAAHISGGYRVPNIDDLAKVFDSKPGKVIVPNPFIKPEKTMGTDFTFDKKIGQHIRWENHFYAIKLFDGIGVGKAKLNGADSVMYAGELSEVYMNLNFNSAYIFGFSSMIKTEISPYFLFTGNVGYTYGQITRPKNEPLDHISPLTGRLGISFKTLNKKFWGEFFALFNGPKRLERYNLNGEDNINYATVLGINGNGTPAWATLNLIFSYKINPHLTFQTGVDNLLDTEYRTFASGINAPGRNFYGTLRYKL